MSDVFDKEKRSEIMRLVKSKNNKSTELRLVSLFKELKIKGWRRSYNVIGKPDFVFLKSRVAVFVDGCFWHGHDCRNLSPTSNSEYWINKISRNKLHDVEVTNYFINRGWKVIRIWECDLMKKNKEIAIEKLKVLQKSECLV